MDPDDINPDGENTPASCPSTNRPNSPQNNLNKSRLIKLARFTTTVYKKELRAKNADASPATIKRLLTKNNTPLNLTNPNKYHSRPMRVSPNSTLPHSFNIPHDFNDISSNSNGKIKINRIPSKYGFQDIVTKNTEVQKSPAHVYMDFLQPIPAVNFWLPLQKNITAHDEKMPDFKPYFGDDDTEGNNEHFYQELETINDDDRIVERARERVIPVGERKLLIYRLLAQNNDLTVLEAMQILVFINDSEDFDFEVEEIDTNMCDEDESLSRTEKMVKRFFIVHSMKKWQDRAIAHCGVWKHDDF